MRLSIGFSTLVPTSTAIQATGLLIITLVGLTPTEYARFNLDAHPGVRNYRTGLFSDTYTIFLWFCKDAVILTLTVLFSFTSEKAILSIPLSFNSFIKSCRSLKIFLLSLQNELDEIKKMLFAFAKKLMASKEAFLQNSTQQSLYFVEWYIFLQKTSKNF